MLCRIFPYIFPSYLELFCPYLETPDWDVTVLDFSVMGCIAILIKILKVSNVLCKLAEGKLNVPSANLHK